MSYLRGRLRWGALGLAGIFAAAAPVFAFALPGLGMLDQLERGRWELREATGGSRSICLGDPTVLVQLEHEGAVCEREVVSTARGTVTVQYTCPGRGYGHSTVRLQTPRLARIETQGLVDRRPFSYRVEARKVGNC